MDVHGRWTLGAQPSSGSSTHAGSRDENSQRSFRPPHGSPVSGDRGVFTLRQKRTADPEWEWDFDLPFHLGRSLIRRLGLAALIAIVLAAPTITTAWSGNARIVTLAAALSGVAGGIIAAFGIQRSL